MKGIRYVLSRRGIDYLLLAIMGLYIFAAWFEGDYLYFGGDAYYPLRPSQNIDFMLYTWSDANGGTEQSIMAHYFKWSFFFIFDKLGLPLFMIQRLYLYLNFILPGLSMYYLTSVIYSKIYPDNNGKRVTCLIAALFFMFNPPVFGYQNVWWPYGVTPFILAFFIKTVDSPEIWRKIKYSLLASFFMFGFLIILSAYNVTAIFLLVLIIYSVIYALFDKRRVKNLLKSWAIFAGLGLLINLWAVLQALLVASSRATQIVSFVPLAEGSWPDEMPLALLHNFMLANPKYHPLVESATEGSFFLPEAILANIGFFFALIAFSAFLLKPKSKMVIFFVLISLLGIIICTGPNPPFGDLYKWLVSSSIYLRGFRTSYASSMFVYLGYAVLIGITISGLYQKVSMKISQKTKDPSVRLRGLRNVTPKMFVFVILLLILINSWPIVTGAYYKTQLQPSYVGHDIPSGYYELDAWLSERNKDQNYRLLHIPDTLGYQILEWPSGDYYGGDVPQFIFSDPVIFSHYVLITPIVKSIYDVARHDYALMIKLMGLLSVKYYYIDYYDARSGYYVREFHSALFPGPEGGYELSFNGDDYVRVSDSPSLYSNELTIEAWIRTANNPIGIEFIPVVTKKEGANEYFFGLRNGEVYAIGWSETGEIAFEVYGGMKVTDAYWHHIVFTTDGITAKTYLDGGLQGSGSVKGKIADTSSAVYLGHDPPYLFLNGVIDEVRILNRALTAEEVVDNYRDKQAILEDSVVALWDFDEEDGTIANDGSPNGNDGTIHGAEYDENLVPAKSVAKLTRYEQSFDKLVLYSINEEYVFPRIYASSSVIPINGSIEPALLKFLNETDFSGDKSVLFLSEQLGPQDWQFIQGLSSNEDYPEVTFERVNPTEYRVHINASKPFFLVLSTRYDDYWTASIAGREISKHFMVNGYANAWYLDEAGSFDVVLKYEVQNYYYIAISISMLTLIGCILYIQKDKLVGKMKKGRG